MSAPAPAELKSELKKSGRVTLDSAGNGVIIFDPDNANQRWEVTSVVVSTNQAATATVIPVATVSLNTAVPALLSAGNNLGSSWQGNKETFTGSQPVGPCDFLSIVFGPPPQQAGAAAAIAGVMCTAIIQGWKYTRRG